MASQSLGKIAGLSLLAIATLAVGAWQASEFFKAPAVSDPAPRQERRAGGGSARAKDSAAPVGTADKGSAAVESPAPAPEPTAFVEVPAKPESSKIIQDAAPQIAKALAANPDLGHLMPSTRDAIVARATEILMNLMGVNGTISDAMRPKDSPAGATIETRGGGPGMEGMANLLKDASIDPSRARVEYFPEGLGMGPQKQAPGERSGGGFEATMRMVSRTPDGEKRPEIEVLIPVRVKGSTGPGDDLLVGVMMDRGDDDQTWNSAGFNLHVKKPDLLQKMMGSMPNRGGRAAPAPKPQGPEK